MVDTGSLVLVKTQSRDALPTMTALRREPGHLIIPAQLTAEIDCMLTREAGDEAARGFIADVAAGRFLVECLTADEYATALQLSRKYRDLRPGLADLSVVVLAHRFGTRRIFTTDQRHFRVMTALDGQPFTLLPWDDS